MNVHDLLSAWPIDGPWAVQPLPRGTNNLTYTVATPSERYILRIYQNTAEQERVRYEHTLLTRLEHMGLSFSVPALITTRSGSTLLPVPDGANQKLAALFHLIPGQHPDGGALAQYRSCGAALAELDQALSHVTIHTLPAPYPLVDDLSQIHPSVPDPLGMLEEMPLEQARRAQLIRIIGDVVASLPTLYRSLPQQIVHGDFDTSNVLMEGDRVTGVLDFESASPHVRAFDLARGLSPFTISPWSDPAGRQRAAAFAAGYRERVELTPEELEALPGLMRLYRVISLIHREGRRRQGFASEADVLARVMALLQQDEWLAANAARTLSGNSELGSS